MTQVRSPCIAKIAILRQYSFHIRLAVINILPIRFKRIKNNLELYLFTTRIAQIIWYGGLTL